MKRVALLGISHVLTLLVGFGLGVYFLPILTAPASPDSAMLQEEARDAMFVVDLTRDLRGSDFLHWGEGKISLTPTRIVHEGALAPGPDYKLYLVKEFVDHEDAFLSIKGEARLIGDIDTFNGFVVDVPADVDLAAYTTVLVWCEAFSEFITAAQYR